MEESGNATGRGRFCEPFHNGEFRTTGRNGRKWRCARPIDAIETAGGRCGTIGQNANHETHAMLETVASHLEQIAQFAPHWGFALVFFFMAVESSFIPFPSEVVMIPAGFLAFRGELTTGSPWIDAALALAVGTLGSLAGAAVNYWLGLKLGRPFLYKYGKYFFLDRAVLERAEDLFRRYGDITTFVCRLVTVIRQIISIPAGFARMPVGRFALFTALGAGAWNLVLLAVGGWFGHAGRDMTYLELVTRGKALVSGNYGWIALGLALVVAAWALSKRIATKGLGK